MNRIARYTTAFASAALIVGCQSRSTTQTLPPPALEPVQITAQDAYGLGEGQLFPFVGEYTRKITTDSKDAQRYFDQGLIWLYGFNHDEAVRSFTEAAEADPGCAMAWWGVAYAQGPNYNASGMNAARKQAAWEATEKAIAQLDNETSIEKALVQALLKRYDDPASDTKRNHREDFAAEMAKLWQAYPLDADVGTLYADAMMVMHPWRLYKPDGSIARDQTLTIVQTLEKIFEFAPYHPGANHLYIHAVEASDNKQRGIAAADRLSSLQLLSGHLNHMPSHIYVQVGMWNRAVEQNITAKKMDVAYLDRSPYQFRQHGYIAHNGHMLAFAAMMVGREKDAMAGAESVWDMPDDYFETMGKRYDRAMCAKYDVMKRFGRWDALLAEPAPPAFLTQSTALWRACRAVAYAAKKDFDNAAIEQAEFRKLLNDRPKDKFLQLNDLFISGEIALQHERWDEAIDHLEKAVAIEDTLGYGEPPRWLQPIRHTLGAVHMKAGHYAEAERVYREDLDRWPDNGWSLFGLTRALELQGKDAQAAATRKVFDRVWAEADQPLDTSCECLPGI